jgi:hypothetical protein
MCCSWVSLFPCYLGSGPEPLERTELVMVEVGAALEQVLLLTLTSGTSEVFLSLAPLCDPSTQDTSKPATPPPSLLHARPRCLGQEEPSAFRCHADQRCLAFVHKEEEWQSSHQALSAWLGSREGQKGGQRSFLRTPLPPSLATMWDMTKGVGHRRH